MLYSGTGERVQVSVDGTPRRFVHDESGRVIGEYGATGTVFAEHVWLMPDTDEGGWEPLALLGATTLSYVHGDHLGVPVEITDASGATVNAMQADPFGQRFYTASTSAPRTSLALPGQIIDIADRHYNLYRDYDPTLGRYLQADPIGLGGADNVYGYVGGNPVNRIDPMGLQDRRGIGDNSDKFPEINRSQIPTTAWSIIKNLVKIGAIGGNIASDVFFPDALDKPMALQCPPSESPVWRKLKPYRGDIRTDGNGYYYRYDRQHGGEIEVYNGRARHVGVISPYTGVMIKPASPGRRME